MNTVHHFIWISCHILTNSGKTIFRIDRFISRTSSYSHYLGPCALQTTFPIYLCDHVTRAFIGRLMILISKMKPSSIRSQQDNVKSGCHCDMYKAAELHNSHWRSSLWWANASRFWRTIRLMRTSWLVVYQTGRQCLNLGAVIWFENNIHFSHISDKGMDFIVLQGWGYNLNEHLGSHN